MISRNMQTQSCFVGGHRHKLESNGGVQNTVHNTMVELSDADAAIVLQRGLTRLGTRKKMAREHEVKSDSGAAGNFRVFVRVRPLGEGRTTTEQITRS